MGLHPFSIRPDDAVLGGLDVGFLLLDEGFVFLGRDDVDFGPHRRVGLAREGRRLAVEDAFFVGPEDDLVALAGDGVALAGQFRHVPGVDHVGGDEVELDRRVDRDHEFVIGEGFVRVFVAPQPLLAGRFDLERFGVRHLEAVGAGCRDFAGLVGEDDAEHEEDGCEERQQGADPQLEPPAAAELPGLGAALAAVAAQGVEEADVDRHDQYRGGDEADPAKGGDLVSAGGMGRQSAAILYSRADAESLPVLSGASGGTAGRGGRRTRLRRGRSPAAPAAPRSLLR